MPLPPLQTDDDLEEASAASRQRRQVRPLGSARRAARSRTPTPNNPHPRSSSREQDRLLPRESASSAPTTTPPQRTPQSLSPWLPYPQQIPTSDRRSSNQSNSSSTSSFAPYFSSLDISSTELISFVRQRRAMSAEPEEWSQSARRGRSFNRLSGGGGIGRSAINDIDEEEPTQRETSGLPSSRPDIRSGSDSTSSSSGKGESDEERERAHFQTVLKAFDTYLSFSLAANNARRRSFYALPRSHRLLLSTLGSALPGPILEGGSSTTPSNAIAGARGFKARLDEIDDRIRRNADVLSLVVQDSRSFLGDDTGARSQDDDGIALGKDGQDSRPSPEGKRSRSKAAAIGHNVDKVRSTIKQFVRDWSTLGIDERQAAYTPILDALTSHYAHLSKTARGQTRVLVPGAGLGRLAFEVAWRGFSCQGNEFSFYMLLAAHFILNKTAEVDEHVLYPFVHSSSNWRTAEDMLRPVWVPDVNPSDLPSGVDFSMVAGEFVEVYGKEGERGAWNAVATCFFIDTARNFARYLEVINHVLPVDGVWINVGPLLWHYEGGGRGEISIELTMEEVVGLIELMGFAIEARRTLPRQSYTGNANNMLTYEYAPEFWKARKVRDVTMAPNV